MYLGLYCYFVIIVNAWSCLRQGQKPVDLYCLEHFFSFSAFFFFYSTFFYLKFWVAILWDSTMKYKRIIWVWNPLICEMDRAFDKEGCELNNDRLLVRKQLHDDTGRSFIYYFLHQSCGSNTVKTGCNLPSRHNLHPYTAKKFSRNCIILQLTFVSLFERRTCLNYDFEFKMCKYIQIL